MALDSYANLTTAIGTWSRRTYLQAQVDEFIAIAESKFNRRLGPNYRRTTTATVNTDTSGEGTLPTDFLTMRSIVRDVLGSRPLKATSWEALTEQNAYQVADDATEYAIRGTTFKVSPVTDDDFILTYDAKLSGLSSGNTSNWLLVLAPEAYLFMVLAAQRAYHEEWDASAGFEQKANAIVDELLGQSNVAQFGNTELYLDIVTP